MYYGAEGVRGVRRKEENGRRGYGKRAGTSSVASFCEKYVIFGLNFTDPVSNCSRIVFRVALREFRGVRRFKKVQKIGLYTVPGVYQAK